MPADDLTRTDDVSAGAWMAPRLRGEFGAVTLTVPSGYERYARVCHPATDECGAPVSWLEVAARTGRNAHPTMQWHALVGSSDHLNFRGSLWPGTPPRRGDLAPAALAALCAILAEHTATGNDCLFALWAGYGWIEEELGRPQLLLPHREYLLFAGPLSAVSRLGDRHGLAGFEPQSPNLFWPADRAWCVASEIDFDSTLVGGTRALIAAILDDRRPTPGRSSPTTRSPTTPTGSTQSARSTAKRPFLASCLCRTPTPSIRRGGYAATRAGGCAMRLRAQSTIVSSTGRGVHPTRRRAFSTE